MQSARSLRAHCWEEVTGKAEPASAVGGEEDQCEDRMRRKRKRIQRTGVCRLNLLSCKRFKGQLRASAHTGKLSRLPVLIPEHHLISVPSLRPSIHLCHWQTDCCWCHFTSSAAFSWEILPFDINRPVVYRSSPAATAMPCRHPQCFGCEVEGSHDSPKQRVEAA